jgi:hypothetical protein
MLRAVAVAGVVVYDLWPTVLPGGFVGVDVFFVISGFLITQQLADEAAASGGISLTAFWARRIRRMLPAGFTMDADPGRAADSRPDCARGSARAPTPLSKGTLPQLVTPNPSACRELRRSVAA